MATEPAVRRRLLRRFMMEAPFQPATNFWRCIELPELAAALPRAGKGLDVGCGDGHLTGLLREIAEATWELVGIDPDPWEAEFGALSGQYVRVHQVAADAIPEPDASFDFAFSNSVLEHIPDVPPCLREVARVLKPGGLFAATVPTPEFRRALAGPDFTRWQTRAEYIDEVDIRLAHLTYWEVDRWAAELRAVGLEPAPPVGYLSASQVRRWELLSNWTGGLLYRLSGRSAAPIQIQRSLGMKRPWPVRFMRLLATPLAAVAAVGSIVGDPPVVSAAGGVLLLARKPSDDRLPAGGKGTL